MIRSTQHSIGQTIFLHLFPGVLVVGIYLACIPLFQWWGLPTIFALMAAILVGVIPYQVGYVFYQAKKQNRTFSLKGVFAYNQRSSWWFYVLISVVFLLWSIFCFKILPAFYSEGFMKTFFFWIPDWFFPTEGHDLSATVIWALLAVGLIANVGGAIAEEWYFRGILLPKISWMGRFTPFVGTLLFTLYHLDSLWQSPERFLNLMPLIFLGWWKKDLNAILIPHCVVNAIAVILVGLELFSG